MKIVTNYMTTQSEDINFDPSQFQRPHVFTLPSDLFYGQIPGNKWLKQIMSFSGEITVIPAQHHPVNLSIYLKSLPSVGTASQNRCWCSNWKQSFKSQPHSLKTELTDLKHSLCYPDTHSLWTRPCTQALSLSVQFVTTTAVGKQTGMAVSLFMLNRSNVA